MDYAGLMGPFAVWLTLVARTMHKQKVEMAMQLG